MKNTSTLVKKVLKNNEINTVILDRIEGDVPALTSRNPDGSYTIVLNNQYSKERLEQEYLHELKHIEEEHFSLQTADEAEKLVRIDNNESVGIFIPLALLFYLFELNEIRELERMHRAKETVDSWIRDLQEEKRSSGSYGRSYESEYYPAGAREDMMRRGIL